MLVRLLRSHQPYLLFIVPILAALLWLPAFFHPQYVAPKEEMPLYHLLATFCHFEIPLVPVVISLLLTLIQAFLCNYVFNKYELAGKHTYIPSLVFVLLSSITTDSLQLQPIMFSSLCAMLCLNAILSTFHKQGVLNACFEAGLFASLATLFYFPSIFLLPFVLVGILYMRPFAIRDWSMVIMGFLLPGIYLLLYYFWTGNWKTTFIGQDLIAKPYGNQWSKLVYMRPIIELGGCILIGVIFNFTRSLESGARSIQFRSRRAVVRLMFVVGVLVYFLSPAYTYQNTFIALTPIVALISGYLIWARVIWLVQLVWLGLTLMVFLNRIW